MGISVWQLLIVLAIVTVLFGGKQIKALGSDLGGAISGFRDAIREVTGAKKEVEQIGEEVDKESR